MVAQASGHVTDQPGDPGSHDHLLIDWILLRPQGEIQAVLGIDWTFQPTLTSGQRMPVGCDGWKERTSRGALDTTASNKQLIQYLWQHLISMPPPVEDQYTGRRPTYIPIWPYKPPRDQALWHNQYFGIGIGDLSPICIIFSKQAALLSAWLSWLVS